MLSLVSCGGILVTTLEVLAANVLPLVGGLAGIALAGVVASAYHNWYVRRKLREILSEMRGDEAREKRREWEEKT